MSTAIWIAIVTIAVQLLPAPALAHAGHTPAAQAASSAGYHRADGIPRSHFVNEHVGAFAELAAAGAHLPPAPSGACNDGCCASGFSCCAPALVSEPILNMPTLFSGREAVRVEASRAGIDPETKPKPPKSFT